MLVRNEFNLIERDHIPQSNIISNADLHKIVRAMPSNLGELLQVVKLDDNKILRFGPSFLEIIRECLKYRNFLKISVN